jgi:hypothetical protein
VLDESFLLSDEEFDALDPEEQQRYLDLLAEEQGEWDLNPRQREAEEMSAELDEFLYGGAAGGGKLLEIDTRVPTPSGWSTIGSIRPGEFVLGRDGQAHTVLAVSDLVHAPAWRLTFDDGSEVVAHDDHLWLTFDSKELARLTRSDPEWRARRRAGRASRSNIGAGQQLNHSVEHRRFLSEQTARRNSENPRPAQPPPRGTVRTTAEIVSTLTTSTGRRNHAIPVADPVRGVERDLPLDPYVLGAWLGDGSSRAQVLTTMDPEMVAAFEGAGFPVGAVHAKRPNSKASSFRFIGLLPHLKALDVLGNKHVPDPYLWASADQRLSLLQGLMDTDGTVAKRSGSAEFCNTNRGLAEAVAHIVRSLGMKASIREGRARLEGRDCGPKWTVKFMPNCKVFRLQRKLEYQAIGTRRTNRFRYIVSAERTEPVDMRCLKVSAEDSLFLVTENFIPTHNSEWLLYHVDRLSRAIPGHASLVLRNSFPELRRSLIRRSFTRLLYDSHECDRPHWRAADKEWRYPNGSVIELGYCQSDDDVGQYLSAEYDAIAFDELTEFSMYQYDMIRSRARTTVAKKKLGARPHIVAATNPGRRGHADFKALFVTGTDYGDRIRVEETKLPTGEVAVRRIGFLPATVLDNAHIDPKYIESLMTLPENLRRQYLEGDWDTFEGQYFPEFQKTKVELDGTVTPWHVIDPFPIPHEWPRFRAIDYGYAAPFACLWFAVDRDGYVYVYREAYETRLTPREQAIKVTKMSLCDTGGMVRPEKFDYTVADPSMWSNREGGLSIAAQYLQEKVQLRKGENDRIAGWGRVRDWLRADENGNPGVRVFSSCTNLIRTLPELVYDKNKPEDLDTTLEDHLADALRYGLMTRPRRFKPVISADSGEVGKLKRMLDRMGNRGKAKCHPDLGRMP